jgi:hypothetical protein
MRIKSAMAGLLLSAAVPALAMAAPAPATGPAGAESRFDGEVAEAKAAMMSNPDVALTHAKAAVGLAKSLPGEKALIGRATGEWLEGEALVRLNHPDRAAPLTEAALAAVTAHAPNTKLHADVMRSRALQAAASGHAELALPLLHKLDLRRGPRLPAGAEVLRAVERGLHRRPHPDAVGAQQPRQHLPGDGRVRQGGA